jgi:hypothetical protein
VRAIMTSAPSWKVNGLGLAPPEGSGHGEATGGSAHSTADGVGREEEIVEGFICD